MSGSTRNGRCTRCKERRKDHRTDDEGLRKLCPDGSGAIFKWQTTRGRLSISMSADEVKVFDILVAHAMGASQGVSKTNPHLITLRRKSMRMRKKATA